MNPITRMLDRYRRGPELRQLLAHARALEDRLHLVTELLRTAKMRCSLCGDMTWQWDTVTTFSPAGRPVLSAVCDSCKRRTLREEARRQADTQEAGATSGEAA